MKRRFPPKPRVLLGPVVHGPDDAMAALRLTVQEKAS